MGFKGYDVFFVNPNSVEKMNCRVCNSFCEVKKNVNGPTSFGESMYKKSHLHDYFYCPYKEEEWHKKALELKKEIDGTNSPSLKKIISEDLNELIKENLNE